VCFGLFCVQYLFLPFDFCSQQHASAADAGDKNIKLNYNHSLGWLGSATKPSSNVFYEILDES